MREGFRVYLEWQNALITNDDICREIFVRALWLITSVTFRRDQVVQVGDTRNTAGRRLRPVAAFYTWKARCFAKLPEVLLYWRERSGRLTRTDRRYSLENFLRLKAYYLTRGPLADKDARDHLGCGNDGATLKQAAYSAGSTIGGFCRYRPA